MCFHTYYLISSIRIPSNVQNGPFVLGHSDANRREQRLLWKRAPRSARCTLGNDSNTNPKISEPNVQLSLMFFLANPHHQFSCLLPIRIFGVWTKRTALNSERCMSNLSNAALVIRKMCFQYLKGCQLFPVEKKASGNDRVCSDSKFLLI